MPGFGNHHSTEAEAGALPIGRNSPQRPPLGLYAEQLSGTSFTVPRAGNRRSWLYRILPSVKHGRGFEEADAGRIRTAPCRESNLPTMPLRWPPTPIPTGGRTDFLSGLRTIATCGDAAMQAGMASHVYAADASMDRRYFQNADGELLVAPQHRRVRFLTELGILVAEPGEIVVIPRGVKFRVELVDGPIRGYCLRELRRGADPPRARTDRRQRPRERAGLPVPGRGVRGRRGGVRALLQDAGADVPGGAAPLAPGRGGMARQRRPLQVRPAAVLAGRRNPLRSPGPVDLHRAHRPPRTHRAPRTSTSSSFRSAGS